MGYFEKLQQDMNALGFTDQPRPVETYRQLHSLLLDASMGITTAGDRLRSMRRDELRTQFGRYAFKLSRLGHELNADEAAICDEAESRLVTTLLPRTIRDDERASPTIVLEDGGKSGIIQYVGRSAFYYALQDSELLGARMGCFYRVAADDADIARPDPVGHAWRLPADELAGSLGHGRLSAFIIDPFDRSRLDAETPYEELALQRSHRSLAAYAAVALDLSRPITG